MHAYNPPPAVRLIRELPVCLCVWVGAYEVSLCRLWDADRAELG